MEVPSDPDKMPAIEEFVLNIAREVKLHSSKHNNLALAVAEASSNSIIHGNKANKNKKVLITVRVNDKQMIITFKDEGKGFDPAKIPDPTDPENILKESGRGIHIMKSFLSELKYNFTPTGTEAILVINLD